MSEKHTPNYEAPITGTMLTPKQCKDCIFRDKSNYTNGEGEVVECGWSKSVCQIYPYPQMKPREVSKNTVECEYYEKEKQRKK